jgi:serine/threonine-protein kinase
MPVKVELRVTKGAGKQKIFTYSGKECVVVGRADDCAIVLPEKTVSRYHCLLDIAPPSIAARDFGSLNGTYLNGKLIGSRGKGVSAEEGRKLRYNEFDLKSGDKIGLSADTEIEVSVAIPDYCAYCYEEIDNVVYRDEKNQPICAECRDKKAPGKKCDGCGRALEGEEVGFGICDKCKKDPDILVNNLLEKKDGGAESYKKIAHIGKGGMGEVWKVRGLKSGKYYALKLMLPKAAANKKCRQSFMREAGLLAQLNHKNILKQIHFNGESGVYWIITELCDGSVHDIMKKSGGKLGVDLATNIILQALDGLAYAHEASVATILKDGSKVRAQGIVHRDFKPANLLYLGDARRPAIKISDFGLAKAFETAGMSGLTFTKDGAGGTPGFMPRYQLKNYMISKPQVDLWSAAASYYFMLTGAPPRDFSDDEDLYKQVLDKPAVPIQKRNPSIPPRLAKVIDRALLENPDINLRSALEFKKEIEGAL